MSVNYISLDLKKLALVSTISKKYFPSSAKKTLVKNRHNQSKSRKAPEPNI